MGGACAMGAMFCAIVEMVGGGSMLTVASVL
jgi:hypothetical protein